MISRPAQFARNLLASAALLAGLAATAATPTQVDDVRLWSGPEGTRLVLDLSAPAKFAVFAVENPDRIVIDLENAELASRAVLPVGQGPVKSVRSGPQADHGLRVVLDLDGARDMRSFMVAPEGSAGHRLVVELPPSTAPSAPPSAGTIVASSASDTTVAAAEAASPVKRLLAASVNGRDLVIAVDAGHGGQDPGALGRGGTQEKNVTLAIARRLAAAIDSEPGMRAVLIRDGDYFITLGSRTRKARQLGADMFVSVHADSVLKREVSGSSVYVLSLRGASDEAARWLAESENAADLKGGVSLDDKDDLLASVLLDVTQKESVSSSVEAADSVLASLRRIGTVHRARVQHAGFVVLKSPDIPSMLVETAFISNAADERRLRDPDHQQRVAEAIRDGVRNYFYDRPPPGTKVAALSAAGRGGGSGTGTAQTLAER